VANIKGGRRLNYYNLINIKERTLKKTEAIDGRSDSAGRLNILQQGAKVGGNVESGNFGSSTRK
jgi:hypothetical protein